MVTPFLDAAMPKDRRAEDYKRKEKNHGKRKNNPTEESADRDIVTTRLFDARRERMWKAGPTGITRCFGGSPKGFTNTFHEFNLRSGGIWSFVMHGPDGIDYKRKSVFVEILNLKQIVFDHVSCPQFQVTVAFDEQGAKTKVDFRMLVMSAAECDKVKVYPV
jgi:uncharacterized protein YndB with AHSA1/START domain